MPKQYVVRQESADNWAIGFDIVSIGPFVTEAAAMQSAIKAACSAGSKVLVEQPNGALRVVWTYGTDPPPS